MPGLEGQGRSEGLVLKKTVDYIGEQLAQRRELVIRLEREGKEVPEKYKESVVPPNIFGSGMSHTHAHRY